MVKTNAELKLLTVPEVCRGLSHSPRRFLRDDNTASQKLGCQCDPGKKKEGSGRVEPAHCNMRRQFITAEFRALYTLWRTIVVLVQLRCRGDATRHRAFTFLYIAVTE
ncbi:hypothetical protein EVAR_102590_1 [Eumeta japonica]|uniref:Uncharacterized protein n=1 Tax=Eumeta variegata TaxID=151549 RepID=A0A4C1TUN5_EUMVA|nr:hypothetical protein EVAR_102590_1 [Eumeta japonica]